MLNKHNGMWRGKLGEINITKRRIETIPGAHPVIKPPYRHGLTGRAFETVTVNKLLAAGAIEPFQSEWASLVVLVSKPGGGLRFRVDYRN